MSANRLPPRVVSAPNLESAPRRSGVLLALLAGAALMVAYVETMLVPALPTLSSFFGNAPYTTVAWVVSAYLLVGVSTIPLLSKLGDIFGKRRVILLVLALYTVAVGLNGFTPQLASLLGVSQANAIYLMIATRGLQGVGITLFPLALSMVGEELPRARVAPAQGLIAAMFAVGSSLGLFAGAWLIQSFGWEFAYRVVIPLAAALTGLAFVALPESRHRLQARLDVPGATLLGATMATFLLALSLAPDWGWTDLSAFHLGGLPWGVPELLGLSGVLGFAFYLRETRAPEPVILLSRFRERGLGLSLVIILLVGIAMFIGFVTLTVLVETPVVGLGRTLFDFGVLSLPTTFSMLVAAPFVGRGIARYGPRPLALLGSGLASAGFLLLWASHTNYLTVMVFAIPTFVGLVCLIISITNLVVLSARRGESGIQTGLVEMFQDLGSSIGPIVVALVLASFTTHYNFPGVGTGGSVALTLPSALGFNLLFAIGATITLAIGGLVALLRDVPAVESEDVLSQGSRPVSPDALSPSQT